jgi:hypothetical protein
VGVALIAMAIVDRRRLTRALLRTT